MKEWFRAHWKTVILGALFFLLFFLVMVPNFLRWVINGPWGNFWPHEKTSPEVDTAFVNAIIGFMTVGVTVLATYLINRQTIKETAKMNNQMLNLMAKQLEIQEQQARSSLRDYVFQQRLEFYLYLLDKTGEISERLLYFGDDFHGSPFDNYYEQEEPEPVNRKKLQESHDRQTINQILSLRDSINEKYLIASTRLQKVLVHYTGLCDNLEYPDFDMDYSLYFEPVQTYHNLIGRMIYLELNLHQIDQDMDDLLDASSKEEPEKLDKEAEQSERKMFDT